MNHLAKHKNKKNKKLPLVYSLRDNGMLVPVRTRFGLRRRGGKTYNVST